MAAVPPGPPDNRCCSCCGAGAPAARQIRSPTLLGKTRPLEFPRSQFWMKSTFIPPGTQVSYCMRRRVPQKAPPFHRGGRNPEKVRFDVQYFYVRPHPTGATVDVENSQ